MTKCKCSGMLEVERSGSKSRAICVRHADILIRFFLRQVAESVSKIQWLQDLQFWKPNLFYDSARDGQAQMCLRLHGQWRCSWRFGHRDDTFSGSLDWLSVSAIAGYKQEDIGCPSSSQSHKALLLSTLVSSTMFVT